MQAGSDARAGAGFTRTRDTRLRAAGYELQATGWLEARGSKLAAQDEDMTTGFSGILPEREPGGDVLYYLLAVLSGALAGWLDIKVGDLLLTAMVVLAANMLLGFLSPRKPWRWVLLVGVFVPVVEWLAYYFLSQKPERAQIYESFLGFLTGIAGAYGGSVARRGVQELFRKPGE